MACPRLPSAGLFPVPPAASPAPPPTPAPASPTSISLAGAELLFDASVEIRFTYILLGLLSAAALAAPIPATPAGVAPIARWLLPRGTFAATAAAAAAVAAGLDVANGSWRAGKGKGVLPAELSALIEGSIVVAAAEKAAAPPPLLPTVPAAVVSPTPCSPALTSMYPEEEALAKSAAVASVRVPDNTTGSRESLS